MQIEGSSTLEADVVDDSRNSAGKVSITEISLKIANGEMLSSFSL